MKCVICGKEIENPYGFTVVGCNPDPVKNHGRCCTDCNWKYVIPMRVLQSGIADAELRAKHLEKER